MTRKCNILPLTLSLAGICYAFAVLIVFPKFTIDDAYILFRYSENLATHGQFTWNLGEPPVEGYTGVFLPLLLAIFIKMGVSPITASTLIGVASFLAGGALVSLALSRLGVRSLVSAWVLLLYFTAPFMVVHALSGLETMLFSAVMVACLTALLYCREPVNGEGFIQPTFFLLALWVSLIRPEGILFSLILIGVAAWSTASFRHDRKKFWLLCSVLYILPNLVYHLWRLRYYGELLPLSFYAKEYTGKYFVNPQTVADFAVFVLLCLAIPSAMCLVLAMKSRGRSVKALKQFGRPLVYFLTAGLTFLVIVLFQYMRSILTMNFAFRFFAPFFPIALISVAVLVEAELRVAETSGDKKRGGKAREIWCIIIAGTVVQVGVYLAMLQKDISFYSAQKQLVQNMSIPAAEYLKRTVPVADWLAVHIDAGAVPYYSGLKTIDMGGINDKLLAGRAKLSQNARVDYFYSFNPAAILFTSYRWDTLNHGFDASAIVEDPRFQIYALAKKYRSKSSELRYSPYYFWGEKVYRYYYFVYVRKDLIGDGQSAPAEK